MIILDTNVLSDLMNGGESVRRWVSSVAGSTLHITSISRAEIRLGIALLPDGRRRDEMTARAESVLADVADRTWSFDSAAADRYGALVAGRRAMGRPITVSDAQIASIASARKATLATRNVDDFTACGIVVVDPFDHA